MDDLKLDKTPAIKTIERLKDGELKCTILRATPPEEIRRISNYVRMLDGLPPIKWVEPVKPKRTNNKRATHWDEIIDDL